MKDTSNIFDLVDGLEPITDPVQLAALAEYEREMEEKVIPAIVEAVESHRPKRD